jgi:hypothetical protein
VTFKIVKSISTCRKELFSQIIYGQKENNVDNVLRLYSMEKREVLMEHRCNKRFVRAIKVMLYHNGLAVVSCKTQDIGVDGIFVETGPLEYKSNTLLKVEFEVASNRGRQSYRLSVIVVHSSEKGLGLYILDSESEAFKVWCIALQRDSSQTSIDEPGETLAPVFA